MTDTIEDMIRRIVGEELAKMRAIQDPVMAPAPTYYWVACTCGTSAVCPLHGPQPQTWPTVARGSQGSTVQHEVPKDYDGLCELERPYYAFTPKKNP